MGKKVLSWIFALSVLVLGAALTVGIAFAGPASAGANEVLTKTPALRDKEGNFNEYVLSDTASWLGDHFFGRQQLISVNNYLTGVLFGTSGADDVILGDSGWLYYASTLDDYTGITPMTDRQMYSAVNNLALMAEYCREHGREFAFVIAPNKNSLYPEHMPDYGVVSPSGNALGLQALLAEKQVSYVDLYEAFAGREGLYFAHDSHWNSRGAALGADLINGAMGVESSYFAGDFSVSQPHQGDLFEMLYPAFTDTEQDPVYGGGFAFEYTSGAKKPDSITLLTRGSGDKSLLCYRDSFGNLLYPYLADSYGDARFSRSTVYDLTQAGDHVVIELVERNLSYLYTYLPVMEAPLRQLQLPEATGTVAVEITTPKAPENTVCVKGTLPVVPENTSPVYIVCADAVYEAFCLEDNSFGAYIPATAQVQGVALYVDGTLKQLRIDNGQLW